MRMAECVHCGQAYSVGVAMSLEPPACPSCGKAIGTIAPEPLRTPEVRVEEPPPPPSPPPPSPWPAALKRAPWKIVLGVVGAAIALLVLRSMIVSGGEESPEKEPPGIASKDPISPRSAEPAVVSPEASPLSGESRKEEGTEEGEPPAGKPPPSDGEWETLKGRFREALHAKDFEKAHTVLKGVSVEFENKRTAELLALYEEFKAAIKSETPGGSKDPSPEPTGAVAKEAEKEDSKDSDTVPPSEPSGAKELRRGLIGHWTFDEGRGTEASDASGNGNGGVLIGQGVRWIHGRLGNALRFHGQEAYVSCGLSRMPSPTDSQSFTLWYRVDPVPGKDQVILSLTNDGLKSGVELGLREGKLMVSRWGGVEIVSAPLPGAGAWHHAAYTFDGSTHVFYVDGKLAARSGVSQTSSAPSRLEFGRRTGGKHGDAGSLDDVRIYGRAISAAEVSALAGETEAPPDTDLPAGAVDLLKLIDPDRDAVRGTWTFVGGALQSPAETWARIEIPYSPPEEYDLEMVVTRTGSVQSLNVGLVGGGRQFHALIDGYGEVKSGLDKVDGRNAYNNVTTVSGTFLKTDEPSTVVCSVRRDKVTVTVDGKEIISWKADYNRISIDPRWQVPSTDTLSIGCYLALFRVDKIQLKPVSGTGQVRVPLVPTKARRPDNPSDANANGLVFEYYEGIWTRLPHFRPQTAIQRGTIDNFDLSPRRRDDYFAFRYFGYVRIPTDGDYTFYVNSDDGCKLHVGSTVVVNNDFTHYPQEKKGTIKLAAGKHALIVEYFEHRLVEVLQIRWEGPGFSKQPIPNAALFRKGGPASGIKPPPGAPGGKKAAHATDRAAEGSGAGAAPKKAGAVPLSQLKKDAASREESVRLEAVRGLAAHRDRSVRVLLSRRLVSDSSDQVRIEAARSLARQKHPDAATALARGLVANQRRDAVSKEIIRSLGALDMCASIPHLLSIMEIRRPEVASEAMDQIIRINCPEAAPGLWKLQPRALADYQNAYAESTRLGGGRTPVTQPNPKYPLAHVYSKLRSTVYLLVGTANRTRSTASWDSMFKRREHLKNLAWIYYCESAKKTFEMTTSAKPRTCRLVGGSRPHQHTFLKHRKP